MDSASLHDILARLAAWTGPPALVTSAWALIQQLHKMRESKSKIENLEAQTASINRKLTPEVLKTLAEAGKLQAEIGKLKAERAMLQASAITERILANEAQLNSRRIVGLIDEVLEKSKGIHIGAEEAYRVFREPAPSQDQIRAAYAKILGFINESRDRGSMEKAVAELKELLRPLRNSIVDILADPVEHFLGIVSFSSQTQGGFAEIAASDNYQPAIEKMETIRNWLEDVRDSYHDLAEVLGRVAAQVELRVLAIGEESSD